MGTEATTRRYAIVGLSNRGVASFARPLLGVAGGTDSSLGYGASADDFSTSTDLVAVVEIDQERAHAFLEKVVPAQHPEIPVFTPDQFDLMIAQTRPDTVIVTGPDDTHVGYILAALAADLDVISEKPLVTTAADASRVLEAERSSRGSVQVTHNLRYTSRHREIQRRLRAGEIGRLLHVSMDYHVDIRHGASYFLRWNRERARSGGLTIHKSTHHLDLISWWVGSAPTTVYAVGGRDFYGPDSPHRPRDAGTPAEVRAQDPYYAAQQGSGTFHEDASEARRGLFDLPYEVQYPAGRDLTLYDEEIDIEDHVSSLVTFASGATAAYSVNFSSPWEGYRATLIGTHGQLELFVGRTPEGEALPGSGAVVLRPLFSPATQLEIPAVTGGHDGADPMMRRDLFSVGGEDDVDGEEDRAGDAELGLRATALDGAHAVAAGEAIWRSIEERRIVSIAELLQTPRS